MYKFLLKRKIKKMIACSERKKAYRNLEEIKSVLVLFDTKDYDGASYFIQQLKKTGKKIKAFAFQHKKDSNTYSNIIYTIVTQKDMKGSSLNQFANILADEKFDLVVDFTLKKNLLLLYILVLVDAPLKIGFFKHTFSVHDIIILFTPRMETIKELGQQAIHYLTIISSEKESEA